MNPRKSEQRSFEIIDDEAGAHDFTPKQWRIVRRMIYTTADFDYVKITCFHPRAVTAGIEAIRAGNAIVTDTHMAQSGIRKKDLLRFGGRVHCLISDREIVKQAEAEGTTRAHAAVDAASDLMAGGIYVIGNAPTALMRLIELIKQGQAQPALIVGLPVGFVRAAESKEALLKEDIPCITNVGRKGGSSVAANVINALLIMADEGAYNLDVTR